MATILDDWRKHALATETMKTQSLPDYHQMAGYNFAQNFPAIAESGIGAGVAKGYQYGQELGRWGLGELGFGKNINLSDAWNTAKEQSDLNILGFSGQGFDMDKYNQWMTTHGYTPPRRGTIVPFMRDQRATEQGINQVATQRRIQEAEAAKQKATADRQASLQAQVTAQANKEARRRVSQGESRDYGKTETRASSGWERSPFYRGGRIDKPLTGRSRYL